MNKSQYVPNITYYELYSFSKVMGSILECL